MRARRCGRAGRRRPATTRRPAPQAGSCRRSRAWPRSSPRTPSRAAPRGTRAVAADGGSRRPRRRSRGGAAHRSRDGSSRGSSRSIDFLGYYRLLPHLVRRRMDLELVGKVAIVTGGASGGLGESMAAGCSKRAAASMVADRNPQRNAELVERLRRSARSPGTSPTSRRRISLSRSRRRPSSTSAASTSWSTTPRRIPRARGTSTRSRSGITTIDTNLRSLFLMSKATVPHIAARGGGSIVNIGSITFAIGMANILPYVTSKGGLAGFTRALAREVGATTSASTTSRRARSRPAARRSIPIPRATPSS